jgi:hypothetical protein
MVELVEVPVQLPADATEGRSDGPLMLFVEARRAEGEQEVGYNIVDGLGDVTDAIRFVTERVAEALKAASPDKYSVELGFEIKVEAGKLVALLAHGGATATIKVTLEWEGTMQDPAA